MLDLLKAVLYGILEGVTEWLPVSSTGHLILLERVLTLPISEEAAELFEVVIQLGAILAVVVLFWKKLIPFGGFLTKKTATERQNTYRLWAKVLIAALPSAVVGLLLDDLISTYLFRPLVVAGALILYGVAFILIENRRKLHPFGGVLCESTANIGYRTAFLIGCFQVLALVPGTSRSGATILGALLLGLARPAAAEFSFFLGIPTMLGASALKVVKFVAEGSVLAGREIIVLLVGVLAAFGVSLIVIRFLMDFVRRHSFAGFGIYRILLGAAVLAMTIFL